MGLISTGKCFAGNLTSGGTKICMEGNKFSEAKIVVTMTNNTKMVIHVFAVATLRDLYHKLT